jgi:hypothetical protein
MAHHRIAAARKHGGRPLPFDAQHGMTDRVDAAMDHVQSSRAHAVVDSGHAEPEDAQLVPRHDAVLSAGERGDLGVRGDLTAHIAV